MLKKEHQKRKRLKNQKTYEFSLTKKFIRFLSHFLTSYEFLFSCSLVSDSLQPHVATPGFSFLHDLLEFSQTHVHWVRDAIQPSHPISSTSLLAFNLSQHQGLHIRWPTYWSFSFSINPSSEYSVLISFSIEWFDYLAVQGNLKSLLH